MNIWRHSLRNLALTLATGFILFFFSERLFWTVWRPGDSAGDQVLTWLAYSCLAYVFLTAVSVFRADDVASVFLAGAIYGWLTEGTLVDTLYGSEASAPFPWSISITGLSWHALISVWVGWHATRRALTARRATGVVWVSVGVGCFWGVWGTFPWKESPPVITGVPQFLGFAAALTAILTGAWWVSFRLGIHRFRPGWFGFLLSASILATFYWQHVSRLGLRPLMVLPGLLGVVAIPLLRHRNCRGTFECDPPSGDLDPSRLAWMALMPATAAAVYAAAGPLGLERLPITFMVYYGITGPAGFLLLGWALITCLRRRPIAGDS